MFFKKTRRKASEVKAGSMADIAFLLLIFFLVTTTILSDQGVLVKLPPWEPDQETKAIKERNMLRVALNAQDQLLVEKQPLRITELREQVKRFVMNPYGDPDLAAKPSRAVVSLLNDRSTTYEAYLQVYNELKAAYTELWNEQARRDYGRPYDELDPARQKAVRDIIPLVISEAEAVDYAEVAGR